MFKQHRPAWRWLYALAPLMGVLFVVADRIPLSPIEREAAQLGIVLSVYGLTAGWVEINAEALEDKDRDGNTLDAPGEDGSGDTLLWRLPASPRPVISLKTPGQPGEHNGKLN